MGKFGHLLAIKQLLYVFCCAFEERGKPKMPCLRVGESQASSHAHARTAHCTRAVQGAAVCWHFLSLSSLSPFPSFSFFFLYLPSSPSSFRFVFNIQMADLGKRASGKQKAATRAVWKTPRFNLRARGQWARGGGGYKKISRLHWSIHFATGRLFLRRVTEAAMEMATAAAVQTIARLW